MKFFAVGFTTPPTQTSLFYMPVLTYFFFKTPFELRMEPMYDFLIS